jgi:hypothetical protein
MLSMIVRALVFFNGMYDLLCFVGIMWFHTLPGFSTFHLSVFRNEEDRRHPLVRRLLAYWILTYGSIRVLAGWMDHESYAMDSAAAMTYFIEIFGFEYELCVASGEDNNNNSIVQSKVTAITLMSLPLATMLLVLRPLEGGGM